MSDDTLNDFTEKEIKNLVWMSAPCMIIAGERESGKSSIAGTLLKKSSFLNPPSDRTKVINYFNLTLDSEEVMPIFDIGGHDIYKQVHRYFKVF
jgi:GTP-binding protein EngB required for normal cell division